MTDEVRYLVLWGWGGAQTGGAQLTSQGRGVTRIDDMVDAIGRP